MYEEEITQMIKDERKKLINKKKDLKVIKLDD